MIAETPLRVLILAMDIARNTATEGHECGPGHNRYQKAMLRCERMQFPKRDARFHRYKAGVFFERQNSIQTPRQNNTSVLTHRQVPVVPTVAVCNRPSAYSRLSKRCGYSR